MNRQLPTMIPLRSIAALTAVVMLLHAALPPSVTAEETPEEVWLVSTRAAAVCGNRQDAAGRVRYWKLQSDRSWSRADRDEFLAGGKWDVPTTIYVHGNRVGRNCVVQDAWWLYRRIDRHAAERPFRFVIWSWPSERVRGLLRRDARVKAARSDVQSYYLAECLQQVDPQSPVCLVGYSFGARVVSGALHLLGGGKLAGRHLPSSSEPEPAAQSDAAAPKRRAILVAGALDANCLLPGCRNHLALGQMERVLVIRNCHDPVLKWYPLMYRLGGPQAMGYAGPSCHARFEKIELLDVSCTIGRNHSWPCYATSPGLNARFDRFTFLED